MFVIQSILLVHFDEKCRQNTKAGLWRILFSTFWYNWSLFKINVVITWIILLWNFILKLLLHVLSFSSSLCRSRGFLDNFAVSIDFGLFLNIRYVCQKLIVYMFYFLFWWNPFFKYLFAVFIWIDMGFYLYLAV